MKNLCVFVSNQFEQKFELLEEINDLGHNVIETLSQGNLEDIDYFIFDSESSYHEMKRQNKSSNIIKKVVIYIKNKIVLCLDLSSALVLGESTENTIDYDLIIDAIITLSQEDSLSRLDEVKINFNSNDSNTLTLSPE